MPNRWIADGDSYITFPTLGNILQGLSDGDTFVFTMRDIDLQAPTTGYIVSQAGSTASQREFGLFFFQSQVQMLIGGSGNSLGNITTLFPANEVVGDLVLTLTSTSYDLSYNGSSIASGTPSVGSNRIDNMLFRIGARAGDNTGGSTSGGFYIASGGKIGDVTVTQNATTLIDTTMPLSGTNVPSTGLGDGTLRNATGTTDVDWESFGSSTNTGTGGSTATSQDSPASAAVIFVGSGSSASNESITTSTATVSYNGVGVGLVTGQDTNSLGSVIISGDAVSVANSQDSTGNSSESNTGSGSSLSSGQSSAVEGNVVYISEFVATSNMSQTSSGSGSSTYVGTGSSVAESSTNTGLGNVVYLATGTSMSSAQISTGVDSKSVNALYTSSITLTTELSSSINSVSPLSGNIKSGQALSAKVNIL